MNKIKYYVNEEKGVVYAVIGGCQYDLLESKFLRKLPIPSFLSFDWELPDVFKGVARLHENDAKENFDAEFGKKLAKARAMKKYKKAKADKMWKYRTYISEILNKDLIATKEATLKYEDDLLKSVCNYTEQENDLIESIK